MKRLSRNIVRCKKCNDVIESRWTHDFVWCSCKAIFTDGGKDYVRRGGELDAMDDLSEYIEVQE